MRVIKFRAWDGKSMYEEIYAGFQQSEVGLNEFINQEANQYTLMQFTGLLDKNGKEIYQGDLLRVEADPEGYGSCSYGGVVEVTTATCGYNLKPISPTFEELEAEGKPWDSTSMWNVCETHSVTGEGTTEVIGNIYENPELINN